MTMSIVRSALAGCAVMATASAALPLPASAQVVYAHPRRPPTIDPFSPYDESYGTSPSYEILTVPNPYGPVARVVERCQYPDGWNVTDFSRDVNGIPNGLDHTCPRPAYGSRLRSRY